MPIVRSLHPAVPASDTRPAARPVSGVGLVAALSPRRSCSPSMAPDPADKKQALDFANYFISYGKRRATAAARMQRHDPAALGVVKADDFAGLAVQILAGEAGQRDLLANR